MNIKVLKDLLSGIPDEYEFMFRNDPEDMYRCDLEIDIDNDILTVKGLPFKEKGK